ncbi:XdhC family protein [Nocardioides currus]|uniref:XshC-Cox1 family protein n=1 Tax=Nocardioides currus TaxID=2133958 RepID=A0A2R7YXF2_9ACTN|nr:XdhC family protein [Nocardioides currus]PUA81068.1 XshC-Cox1 family protein [Nocardioides currus]
MAKHDFEVEALEEILEFWRRGESVGVATVVATRGSAPRQAGAAMIVSPDGRVTGSVSGGCVEAAVYDEAMGVISGGAPVLARYGFAADEFSIGLTCGGELEVFIERIDRAGFPNLDVVQAAVRAGEPVAVATVVDHPQAQQRGRRLVVTPRSVVADAGLGSDLLDISVREDALALLAAGHSAKLIYGSGGEPVGEDVGVFVRTYVPPPRLVLFGAVDFSAALCDAGRLLGYQVTVCDARSVFASADRFRTASEVVVDWPHRYLAAEIDAGRIDERTVVVVLTHDPKFDVPVLKVALAAELAFVGAMGSRTTHDDRVVRLRNAGVGDDALDRLHSPIGLDLRATTPPETAVSILAEVIAERRGGTGRPLRDGHGSIHEVSQAVIGAVGCPE